jgi:hypothetical protein
METNRLRTIQQPNFCEELVEACVHARKLLPPGAQRVASRSELTMPLRGLTRRNAPDDEYAVWLAWSHVSAICYVAGTFSLDLSRERGRPVLHLLVYNRDGALQQALTCVQTPANHWERLEGL